MVKSVARTWICTTLLLRGCASQREAADEQGVAGDGERRDDDGRTAERTDGAPTTLEEAGGKESEDEMRRRAAR